MIQGRHPTGGYYISFTKIILRRSLCDYDDAYICVNETGQGAYAFIKCQ